MREREEKLGRLVNSAMDAIIELDQNLNVTRVNPAAEKVFGCSTQEIVGQLFTRFLSSDSRERLANLIIELDLRPEGERYTVDTRRFERAVRFRRSISSRGYALSIRHGTRAVLHVDSTKRECTAPGAAEDSLFDRRG